VNLITLQQQAGRLNPWLLALLRLQIFHKNLRCTPLIITLRGSLLFNLVHQTSPVFHERVNRGITEI
jgi:hypothetical protein